MKMNFKLILTLLLFVVAFFAKAQDELYTVGQESLPQAGVPQGKLKGPFIFKSKLYPGTERNYWLYVPAQYDSTKPTCTMFIQDGLSCAESWKIPTVLDNLIHKKDVPVIIGVFIDHGKVPAKNDEYFPRFNRSYEYDALGDQYARFLLKEIIPEVSKRYNLSSDPNDRSIAGSSSGAICAFNAAWERPDAFRRVFSGIGTYVGLRGADEFPTLIRKSEPKPLRIYLQDGSHDLNIYAGDWWMANQAMLSALEWWGYEVTHTWGEGQHSGKHAAAIMPDVLRWLWKDYPKPIETHPIENRNDLLMQGNHWIEIPLTNTVEKIAVDKHGHIFFYDKTAHGIFKMDSTDHTILVHKTKDLKGMMFGLDQKIYAGLPNQKTIVSIDSTGKVETIVKNVTCDAILTHQNGVYFTETKNSRIGFYSFATKKITYTYDIQNPVGLALSSEQTFMLVSDEKNVFGYSLRVQPDGSLAYAQPYIHYHIPYGQSTAEPRGMTVDINNRVFTATNMGIQMADQLGRINFIFEKPLAGNYSDVKFGGKKFDDLYVVCDGKLFRRKVKSKGVLSWQAPVNPPRPKM